ncbi:hypothetical protein GH714_037219 [Hevea brasiliensis]|uniref:Peptidase M28 domain-containing protein n=1 Tax=Hevea brasiliensis TaxID=3981 RepID=A0A6A6KKW2_HEVBR|nr:hypothetical protein GH714_037219 [Hevea brasiliensis]
MSPPLTKPTASLFSSASKPPPPLCTFLFFLLLCILGFYTLHHPHPNPREPKSALRYRNLFLSFSSNFTLASYLRALTLHPHLAGTQPSLDTTDYVYSHFKNHNLETHKVEYTALLSYPSHASLVAHFANGSAVNFSLTEISGKVGPDVVPPYHAYSPSGAAHAKVVFVNYGREEDYRSLEALGVNVSGAIVRGEGWEERRKRSRERDCYEGSGGPTEPGVAGVKGGERLGLEDSEVLERFPKIPSLPLSCETADAILGSLRGPMVPREWRDSGLSMVGPGPTLVKFTYQGEKKEGTINNVFAVIRGLEEPDRYVILGNHRDAWTYGAVDPNSGTAALLDIARRFSLLMRMEVETSKNNYPL